ncbi:5-formyltetrahydrofolate cyclo-ligase [Acidimangrovimonas sediminis]|uniref:5-formyltetrahydrofolate cyclo-ligase n=1 Tax=Acidimangrovimonas sediminis TaxID=2056283 RepID=UPI000C7FFD04|nr:5-formyltetrahydrofolate cyclo-ligase [Acidimangrovimonas sediminis]
MSGAGLAETKAAARKAAFAARKAAFAEGQGYAVRNLLQVLGGHAEKSVSGYMPMRTEIDPLPAMAAHPGPVCVPVILGRGQPLGFREWTPCAAMVTGEFGALIPEAGAWIEPEVLIVPLLAFDRRGYRLGYGGGFYDRTLQALRARRPTLAIGYAFAAQEVAEVPIEATDEPLDLIVTDTGVIAP